MLIPATLRAACQCPVVDAKEQEKSAAQIFTGRIIELAKDKKSGKQLITFETDETYKGDPPDTVTLIDQEEGTPCALELKKDAMYIVYSHWVWADLVTSQCFGTKFQQPEAVAKLGPADSLKDDLYPMLEKACMGHSAVNCCLNSVKAMRQGHFMPVPEKGCPEEMIPDRLKCFTSYTWCIPDEEFDHRHH